MTHGTVASLTPADAAERLRAGEVAVVPTETVYGLAVKAGVPAAFARVFALKDRPATVHLPVMLGSVDQLAALGVRRCETGDRLAAEHWPGPLTIVWALDAQRPAWLAERTEVAVRVPDHTWLRDLATLAGPLLVTSANRHGQPPAQTVDEAVSGLAGRPDLVVDGGRVGAAASTIVNVCVQPARVERVGALSAEALRL